MMKKFALISVVFLIFGIVLGGPLLAEAEIIQSLLIGAKQDPGGGFKNDDLNDTYSFRNLSFQNFESATPTANITYGTLVFHGNGNWTGTATEFDSDGTTDSGPFNGTYSVNANGSFNMIIDNPTSPDAVLTGHLSRDADRQFIVVSQGQDTGGSIHQGIASGVRAPDNAFVTGDLNGKWFVRALEVRNLEEGFRDASICTATIVFNNLNWSGDLNCFNSDDTVYTATVSGTYTLVGNTFNLYETGNPEVLFSAYLSRDKSILVCTRGSSSGADIEQYILIALKESPKVFTDADLSGAYFFHQASFYDFETNSREAARAVGTITFDGNRNWTATLEAFASDGGSGPVTASGTYSVNADGSFTLIVTSDTPNTTLTGNISGDNETLIMTHTENVSSGGGGTDGGGGGGGGGCLISTSASD